MGKANEIELNFGRRLSVKSAEEAIRCLATDSDATSDVKLNLSQCRYIDIGAGWRLGCALRRFKSAGSIEALVPPPGDFDKRWFLDFTRSGLGFALARYAISLTEQGENITDRMRRYYQMPRSKYASPSPMTPRTWLAENFVLIPDLGNGLIPLDNITPFRLAIGPLFDFVRIDQQAYNRVDLAALFRLIFEASQNVWDHADRPPLPRSTRLLSYLSLRHYRKATVPHEVTSHFECFLNRYRNQLPNDVDTKGMVEIVVIDDGVGIAARHARRFDIYQGSIEEEQLVVSDALADGSSIKLKSQDATVRGQPGFGYAQIRDSLEHLSAFCLVRTGRCMAYFDPTAGNHDFQFVSESLGYMPGTALQIVLPARIARVWN